MTIEKLYSLFLECSSVAIYVEDCTSGALYFDLKEFYPREIEHLAEALRSGCRYVVTDNREMLGDERVVWVGDALETLQQLARHHRMQFDIPVIAVTGTNGKTTTCELMTAVLRTTYPTMTTEDGFNNDIGMPFMLLRLNKTHRVAVIEMGTDKPNGIQKLVEIAQPTMGLITNIGIAHLEGFGSPEMIVQTKKGMYDYLRAHHRPLFVNGNDSQLLQLSDGAERICYGNPSNSTLWGRLVPDSSFLEFALVASDGELPVATQLVGAYNLPNALAACAVGRHLGIDPAAMKKALEQFRPRSLRSQYYRSANNELVIDLFNANPSSMEVALREFARRPEHPKLAILGDMKELGSFSADAHRRMADLAVTLGIDDVWICGEEFAVAASPLVRSFSSTPELIEFVKENPPKNKTILLKGSRAMQLECIGSYL